MFFAFRIYIIVEENFNTLLKGNEMTSEQYLEHLRATGIRDEKITELRKKFADFDLESAEIKKEYAAKQEQERKEKDALFFTWIGLGFWCLITMLFPIAGFSILGIGLIIGGVFYIRAYNRFKQANTETESEGNK